MRAGQKGPAYTHIYTLHTYVTSMSPLCHLYVLYTGRGRCVCTLFTVGCVYCASAGVIIIPTQLQACAASESRTVTHIDMFYILYSSAIGCISPINVWDFLPHTSSGKDVFRMKTG